MVFARVGEIPEGSKEDVDRGEARIDPKLMDKLDLERGNPVKVEGDKETTCKAVKGYSADRGLGIVRIDEYLKKNAGTSLGETV
jgi:Cell division protein 48 (CDC48), N-terminal domain.